MTYLKYNNFKLKDYIKSVEGAPCYEAIKNGLIIRDKIAVYKNIGLQIIYDNGALKTRLMYNNNFIDYFNTYDDESAGDILKDFCKYLNNLEG